MRAALSYVREPLETLLILIGLVLAWQFCVVAFKVPNWLVPAPTEIYRLAKGQAPLLARHFYITATGAILGLVLGALAAIVLAIIMANIRVVERVALPLLLIDQSIPKVALAPLFVIWFGSGMASRVIMAGVVAFLPMVINTVAGLTATDPRIDDLMKVLSAGRLRTLWKVQLPSAVPYIFSGLKVSMPLAIIGAVVSEFMQSDSGLGYVIVFAVTQYNTALIFAALVLIAGLSLAMFGVVRGCESLVLRRRFAYLSDVADDA